MPQIVLDLVEQEMFCEEFRSLIASTIFTSAPFVVHFDLRVPIVRERRASRLERRNGLTYDIEVKRNSLAVFVEILGAVPGYANTVGYIHGVDVRAEKDKFPAVNVL